ncbi:hypothetical protein V1284_001566 [Nitrobacteraceae bacterium AZCC 2299]
MVSTSVLEREKIDPADKGSGDSGFNFFDPQPKIISPPGGVVQYATHLTMMSKYQDVDDAHRRARFMRPDAARYMRSDAARWIRPDVARFLKPERQRSAQIDAAQ